jgi:hypothetical protein
MLPKKREARWLVMLEKMRLVACEMQVVSSTRLGVG